MFPKVLYRVCFGTTTPQNWQAQGLAIKPAILHGYTRRKVRGSDYPAITACEGSSVRGAYVTGLTDGDIWRLDVFEGSMYERREVKVKVLAQVGDDGEHGNVEAEEVECETYVWIKLEKYLEAEEWDFAEFKREKLSRWTGEDDEYQGS